MLCFVDIAKGAAAVAVGLYLLPSWSAMPDLTALVCAVTAILGHGFSPFVGFKGGKGVATAAGAFITLTPVAALSAIVVWAVLLVATRIMSVASVAAAAVLPVNLLVFELLQRGRGALGHHDLRHPDRRVGHPAPPEQPRATAPGQGIHLVVNAGPIAVIGAGSWGTAVAASLARHDGQVRLWARRSRSWPGRSAAVTIPGT